MKIICAIQQPPRGMYNAASRQVTRSTYAQTSAKVYHVKLYWVIQLTVGNRNETYRVH